MPYYPINLNLAGRRCAVIGGGAVAERKALTLLAAGAAVTIFSPQLTSVLSGIVRDKKIEYFAHSYRAGDIKDFFMVIIATNDPAVNRLAAEEAKANGALINIADAPELCDFTVPATISRGDLVITVSTGGKSPAMARRVREEIEELYGMEYGLYLDLIGRLRRELKEKPGCDRERTAFWRQAVDREVLDLLKQGRLQEAEEKIEHAISCAWAQS